MPLGCADGLRSTLYLAGKRGQRNNRRERGRVIPRLTLKHPHRVLFYCTQCKRLPSVQLSRRVRHSLRGANTMSIVHYSDTHMKPLEWYENVTEMLFDRVQAHRVVGGAAFIAGLANILDTRTGDTAIVIDSYSIPLPIHIAFMALLAVSGVVLALSLRPHRAWFLPMAIFAITVPIATLTTLPILGIKTLATFGLLAYFVVRIARREGE